MTAAEVLAWVEENGGLAVDPAGPHVAAVRALADRGLVVWDPTAGVVQRIAVKPEATDDATGGVCCVHSADEHGAPHDGPCGYDWCPCTARDD